MNQTEITKLVTYIEENLRSSPTAGLEFVDSRLYQARLTSSQNHVVFGRRGAGKTTLANSIKERGDHIDVHLNLEDYKDITFPNIIVRILVAVFEVLLARVCASYRWYRFWCFKAFRVKRQIKDVIPELKDKLLEPDSETQQINTIEEYEQEMGASGGITGLSSSASTRRSHLAEVKREVPVSKINFLRLELPTLFLRKTSRFLFDSAKRAHF